MTRDEVRLGDRCRSTGRMAHYGVLTVVELDEESFEMEAEGRGAAGVIVEFRAANGQPARAYVFLDQLALVARGGEPAP